jgi:cyclophilin family peptidyl-prolyl cis-trans isomerase
VEILQWLQQQMPLDTESIVLSAASKGHIEVLRWLQSTDLNARLHYQHRALADAIQGEHLEVVKFLHEECKFAFGQYVIATHLSKCQNVTMHEYVLDRAGPLLQQEQRAYFERVVSRSSLEVLQYLVLDRGLWNRAALAMACQRRDSAMSQFIYAQAKTRARQLQRPLEEQLDFSRIRIGFVWSREVAVWMLQCVPEVSVWGRPRTSINDGHLEYPKRKHVLLACIRYRPAECRAVPWLPEWAVRVNSLEALKLLEASDHPNLRDLETFEAIIQHTRDARLMLKLLPLAADSPPSLRKDVVQWATQFGMVTVLDRVFGNEEPKTQEKLLKQLVGQAGVSTHTEVVEWLLDRCSLLGVLGPSAAKAIPLDALRHGHTASLMSLHKRQLLRGTSGAIAWMVSEAAQARQVRSLEWLLENLTIPEKLIASTLIDAVRHNHTEIVAFLTGTYDPSDLAVRDHDRSGVREFLLKQGGKAGVSVASKRDDEEKSTNQDEAKSTHHRAKRARWE